MKGGAISARYIFISNILSKIVLFFGSIILARVLSVEDFGYLLTLNILFGFINLFSISGYEFYFIQNKDYQGDQEMVLLRQVFNLRIIQSILLFIITNGIAFYIWIYNDPVLAKLLSISSFLFLIALISKPEEAQLSKSLDFKRISISRFARDVGAALSKIGFAFAGLGPLTFSYGNLVGNTVYSLMIKAKHNLSLLRKTTFADKVEEYSKIRKFGFNLFLNTSGSYFTKQVDKFFVASYFDKNVQGNYQFANNYASYTFNAVIAPQTSMVLSLMAKNREHTQYLLKLFKYYGVVAIFLLCPVILYVIIFAKQLIPLVFGSKWEGAVFLFQIFSIYYLLKVVLYPTNGILTSMGRPDIKARITIISFVITIPILIYVSFMGYQIATYAIIFVTISTISDGLCAYRGFQLMQASYFRFLGDRLVLFSRHIALIVVLTLILTVCTINYLSLILGLLATVISTYLILFFNYEAFSISLQTFIKEKRILRLLDLIFLQKT
ncbi:oligosaccharide flippase family protein [Portibacter marinus]|uniref:oligosaccharide flippase family protein n=1 Tax=Portibacter marinus TaxID=2898660 RepID=UPI001F378FC0|nr:oligosaccharide flippase family protein [Portibacter marinus]